MRIGIDVGGTFTDLVLIDDDSGRIFYTKTLSTPADLARAVLTGISDILTQAGVGAEALDYVVHGTTVGTNALIERKGAKVGLLTTSGFRDVLEIARIERPDAGLYDMTVDLPDPLVPRYLRLEADERIGSKGEVIRALDEESVARAAEIFQREQVEAVAVCLLFSFRNPSHEQLILETLEELLPNLPVTLSSDIAPEFREYERTSTCVINAYLLPVTRDYVERLSRELASRNALSDLRILQASGGSMTAEVAKSHAVHMVNSGPAGGALASAVFGKLAGEERIVGVDMGGTSFDVSLIVDGEPRLKSEGEFEGYPVKIPMIDVEGIGAGGGSIAWVDSGGALNVGPQSAGADPGPACYGLGGTLPTVTDANLVLGRLNPAYFLGAEMELHFAPAQEAVEAHVATPLALSIEEAAAGIIRVVNANMVRGISVSSTQKGYDLREFSLLAFGGAGPLHAVELAQELRMARVIIPPYCSVFSAFGAVASDVRHDYVKTLAWTESDAEAGALEASFAELEARALSLLEQENVARDRIRLHRAADMRYEGQSYELTIPLNGSGPITEGNVRQMISDFHAQHQLIYAYSDPKESIEMISLRLAAVGLVPSIQLESLSRTPDGPPQRKAQRAIYFSGSGFLESNVYERRDLASGSVVLGPCLIEERTSTTVIPPGWQALIDTYGNHVISPAASELETTEASLRVEA